MKAMFFACVRSRRLAVAVLMTLTCGVPAAAGAQSATQRPLRNGWEIHRELPVPAESRTAVGEYFPSFLEYQDLVMFHPTVGYYGSGRVNFSEDYQTYPIVLAPFFGHMIAEQLYLMWDGMRTAGTLGADDRFTIAEFGAGNGVLAESILDYLDARSRSGDPGWQRFAEQVLYVCYDRSPALNDVQRERNRRFGDRFEARIADATDLDATIPAGSIKGVVLSNELPDAFSVHKVILIPDGDAEVAFVAPSMSWATWQRLRPTLPSQLTTTIETGHRAVVDRFLGGTAGERLHLTRASFVALLEQFITSTEYESIVSAIEFREIYAPASVIPDLQAHLQRYAGVYGDVLSRQSRGLVTYVNLGAERFIQGAAHILASGYVLTIDYGTNWEGLLAEDSVRFRTYGPARREADRAAWEVGNAEADDRDASDPYVGPTLNDMTTDVNFSLLAAEGDLVGLKALFYGSQRALGTGTHVSLEVAPANHPWPDQFHAWAAAFGGPSVYKMLLQQKEGTDPAYRFRDDQPEPLGVE